MASEQYTKDARLESQTAAKRGNRVATGARKQEVHDGADGQNPSKGTKWMKMGSKKKRRCTV